MPSLRAPRGGAKSAPRLKRKEPLNPPRKNHCSAVLRTQAAGAGNVLVFPWVGA